MARYNKIFAGPFTEATPQVQERRSDTGLMPGTAAVITAEKFVQAGANSVAKLFIIQDDYLTMKGVDTAYANGDTHIGMELLDEQFFNVRVATGNNIVKGSPLTTTATGRFAIATSAQVVVAFAEEAFNNNTGSDQLVRVRAAKGGIRATA